MSQWILYNTAMAYAIKKLKFARTIENYLTCYHYIIVNASYIIKTYPTDFDLLLLLLLLPILLLMLL